MIPASLDLSAVGPIDSPDRCVASQSKLKPELLAPAGDMSCLVSAVENGADAIYFGLSRHNARIRAKNFRLDELPEVMTLLHRRGVRGYVTLNTLAFPSELADLEITIRGLVSAGVDALIVQDLGLCRMIRALDPEMDIHASTQMSITSAEGANLARDLGCSRVILARELSLEEIALLRSQVEIPLEVFVHGALCVAYSGQCLTSESLGGRSANRGECAQACRLPYEIICDGRPVDLGRVQYLLSPQDLAAYDLVPRLVELGVSSLKIEGRLKSPEYVAVVTQHYRRAIDDAWEGRPVEFTPRDVEDMELSFSRGFSHGFLDGTDHKALVRGDYSKKRGIFLGRIDSISRSGVSLRPVVSVKPGDGLVFDVDEHGQTIEQGGRVYEVIEQPRTKNDEGSAIELRFGREDIDLKRLHVGQGVWKTDDPELTRRLRKSFQGAPSRLVDLDFVVKASVGAPLRIEARSSTGYRASVTSSTPLEAARSHCADEELFRAQLGRLGGSIYRLRDLTVEIDDGPMVPMSLLNHLRREMIRLLDAAAAAQGTTRNVAEAPVLPILLEAIRAKQARASRANPVIPAELTALCRQTWQIQAALDLEVRTIYADFQDIKEYANAVVLAKRGDATIYLATPRIEKPREANLFRYISKLGADGILVRNAGGLEYCARSGVPFVADFSLNAANALTVGLLMEKGARKVTASYDLSGAQLVELVESSPPDWLEIVVHQQMPMFHMEHCVFCAFLSPGTDHTNCGRPCDLHDVKLRDRVGMEHPLKADVGCRNTLFNAIAQTAAEYLPTLITRGARQFRLEFLDDSPEAVKRTIALYRDTVEGRRDGKTLWRELRATNHYGVTRGPLAVL